MKIVQTNLVADRNLMAVNFALLITCLPLLLFLRVYFMFQKKRETNKQNKRLPPRPVALPVLGNWHQLGELLHRSYWNLSKKYGPVMLVRIGQIKIVVVSSAEAARDVLKVHDLACCSRPSFAGARRLTYNFLDVALSPYGDNWRNMKKLTSLELFNPKRVQSFQSLREDEVELLANSITDSAASESSVNLVDMLFALTMNITLRISFGFDHRETEFDTDRFHELADEALAFVASFSRAELFPVAGWIMDWIEGRHAKIERVFHELDSLFQFVINDHLKPGKKRDRNDIVDVLLRVKEEQAQLGATEFSMNNIKAVIWDLFLGGTATTAITVNWAMAELVRNPRVMQKVQDEVRSHIGSKGKVAESDLDKLQYLQMVIKETFRMHPAAPLLLPRETMSDCKIGGYDIDPKTMIQINIWAIGRDPKYWKEPEKFYPERFADSSIDYKGLNFEFLPFGGGRRMCPGVHLGTKM